MTQLSYPGFPKFHMKSNFETRLVDFEGSVDPVLLLQTKEEICITTLIAWCTMQRQDFSPSEKVPPLIKWPKLAQCSEFVFSGVYFFLNRYKLLRNICELMLGAP